MYNLQDNFSESFDIFKSKSDRVVFGLFKFIRFTIKDFKIYLLTRLFRETSELFHHVRRPWIFEHKYVM